MLSSSHELVAPTIRDLKQLIAERRIDFPPVPGQAMKLLLSKPDIIAFGSLKSVAQACHVSAATVVRLASRSGYSNFKEMRGAFRQYLIAVATTNQNQQGQQRMEDE